MTHRNADTRIREAFDALRSELREVFGSPPPARLCGAIDGMEAAILEYAKLPADA